MILKLNGPHRIDNLRHYAAELVERLCSLLSAGAPAQPDVHRKGFYDLEDGDRTYYIHLTPSGRVLLLAIWQKQTAPQAKPLANVAACCG